MEASASGPLPRSDRRHESSSGRDGEPAPPRVSAATHLANLMTSCGAGDEVAFAELYDLTIRRVHGTVLRVLRSHQHAEEVTQEVYVEIWRQAPKYAPEKGSVMGWIATMAHRRAVDRVRSVSSEVARDEQYAHTGGKRETDEVWDSVEQQHDVRRVRSALATLTPIQQQAVQLAYLDGLTQTEIARSLGLPMGTVKTRLRDGLRRLGDALRGEARGHD
jgi:RNA polymerase sigma-70 factor (ECF subfamily)